jgi:hypothetical protein
MIFNQHSDLEGKHAFLSASKYHWINYTPERLLEVYDNSKAAEEGVKRHAFAHFAIELGQKLPNTSQTLNLYVNDCIGYRMTTEQLLVYSRNSFGTADAIDFRDRLLRIFDLKTGVNPASGTQLKVYAALFCLEYKVPPTEIDYDLRLYQNDDIDHVDTDPEEIMFIMDRIVEFDQLIEEARKAV